MQDQKIVLDHVPLTYSLRVSKRARYISVSIDHGASVTVTVPKTKSMKDAEEFLHEKKEWILKHVKNRKHKDSILLPNHKGKEYIFFKQYAKEYIQTRIDHFNQVYRFDIHNVYVKNQKSQWGSCSTKRNINFSYRIVFLPEKLADYIIVHELCHLDQHNHGKEFWNLVEKTIPDYKQKEIQLKKYHLR